MTDVTREKRTYKAVDSVGVKENIGKGQEQESDDKAANQRSGNKTVTPNKETKDEEIKTTVRLYFSNMETMETAKSLH